MIDHLHPVDTPDDLAARRRLATAGIVPALGIVLLWCLFLLNASFGWRYERFGIHPGSLEGLRGIVLAPLVHGGFEHIFDNSVALLVLGWCLVYFYPKAAGRVLLATWILGGALVWITARHDVHIGASGVLYGIAAFLFFSGLIRRQRTLMAVSLLVVFLYGGLVWGILPIMPELSWESHLWGGFAGAAMALLLRKVPPAHLPKPIVFTEEEEAGEEPPTTIIYNDDPGDSEDPEEQRLRQHLPRGTPIDPERSDVA